MAAQKDYSRLGLFLFLVTIVVLATALLFVQRSREREVLDLVTYTDQNVTGRQSPDRDDLCRTAGRGGRLED